MLRTPKSLKNKPTIAHQYSPKQEHAIASRVGGYVTKGSGRGNDKGDARVKSIVKVEAKCTSKSSYTLKRSTWEKIENEAISSGEAPAMEIHFIDEKGTLLHKLAILPTYVLDQFIQDKR